MEIKVSTQIKVPVALVDSNGDPITGLTYSDVTVYLQKQAGSSASKSLVEADWTEIDATNFPGVYDLLLSTSNTDTVGLLKYSVKSASSDYFFGTVEIVANVESDTYLLTAGRWKIDTATNTFIIYGSDGVTPLRTFDLKDSAGSATSSSIYERVPQ